MEEENKSLADMSKKLGVEDRNIINKASEYLRLLNVKNNVPNIDEYSKTVICLDIAATNANDTLSPETILTVLPCGKSKYRKTKNTIQKILKVTPVPNVKSICCSLLIPKGKELESKANNLLRNYKNSKGNGSELSHPQYDAMAVYQTSKMMKVKVPENKLMDFSHLTRVQWTNLKNQWHRWQEENKINLNTKRKGTDVEYDPARNGDDQKADCKENIKIEEKTETYERWKKRILDKAYADLELIK